MHLYVCVCVLIHEIYVVVLLSVIIIISCGKAVCSFPTSALIRGKYPCRESRLNPIEVFGLVQHLVFGLDSGRVQEQIPGAVDTGLTLHTAAGVLLLF